MQHQTLPETRISIPDLTIATANMVVRSGVTEPLGISVSQHDNGALYITVAVADEADAIRVAEAVGARMLDPQRLQRIGRGRPVTQYMAIGSYRGAQVIIHANVPVEDGSL